MRYYQHVRDDGTECQFNDKPSSLPTSEIERLGGFEFVETPRISKSPEATAPTRPQLPRGEGWFIWIECDVKVVWRRQVPRKQKK